MAGVKLYISTSSVWSHFFNNFDRLQNSEDCIAENTATGSAVYLTACELFPQLVVYEHDQMIGHRLIGSEDECNKWAIYYITKYVAEVPVEGAPDEKKEPEDIDGADEPDDETDGEQDDYEKALDTIYVREDDLSKALGDFLSVVLCEDDCTAVEEAYGSNFMQEVLDDFLQYLYDHHMISVWRPVLDYDEDSGCDILKEFPYGWEDEFCDDDFEEIED